ncbi:hypothetical protein [Geobacillus thermoleovorans]|uniref:hypothetical protein n=1 Tax=Geobacillus thermoleovorans TaxID=33941 RepID=UPI000F4FC5E9|nr:hypothetical protein [Geobacillus thermoleovorans]
MKLTPERRRQIYEITQKILAVYDRFFSFVLKLYEKPGGAKEKRVFPHLPHRNDGRRNSGVSISIDGRVDDSSIHRYSSPAGDWGENL